MIVADRIKNMKKESGVTLVELIIVIAIVAITVTIGVPSFQTMFANNRIAGQSNTFVGSLYLARSEAVKWNQQVDVVSGGDWNTGWQGLTDTDNDGSIDDVLQTVEALTGGTTFSASTANTISYDANGRVTAGTGAYTLNNTNAGSTRNINLNLMGRVSLMCGANPCI